MKPLPDNVVMYKRTPQFTSLNTPAGLLDNHTTKVGVWAKINVEKGAIEYTIDNDKTYILTPDIHGIIEPQIPHYIKPSPDVSFFIEFYRIPETSL